MLLTKPSPDRSMVAETQACQRHEESFVMRKEFSRIGAFGVAIALSLLVSACASKTNQDLAGGGAGGGPPGSQQDFVVNVGDRIFFETDSTDLTATAQATLDKQAQWLNKYSKYQITMEGHADERGTREYNLALGARRSQVARDYLASKGINPGRIRNISYG